MQGRRGRRHSHCKNCRFPIFREGPRPRGPFTEERTVPVPRHRVESVTEPADQKAPETPDVTQ